ncbi:MAG: type VI secretion system protein TssA [Gammaproteobacteria bacterium]|jgi:type VI secretion system protein ImpA|nr:type VI secretion system protein TssA [Gammaproteobacteria bacterium]
MATPEIVDINGLLQPVSEASPAGSDIREDSSPTSPYYSIKDARNAARAAERNSMFDGASPEATESWRKVIALAPDILKNQGKDLEVACWYTEALIRRHGFQGLRDGFSLIRQLIEKYWENLYPMPDEDGMETRVAPLAGLNGEGAEGVLIAPIRNVNITEGASVGPFNYWQYQQALDVQKITDEEQRAAKSDKLEFSLDDIERAVNESSEQFYVNLRDDLQQAIDEFRKASRLLDGHCGTHHAPPSSNIITALENSLGAVKYLGKNKLPSEDAGTESAESGGTATAAAAGGNVQGALQNRADAFRKLTEISEFFRKTEPHSPLSYILARAVKWGDMPLDELIMELIPESSARDHFRSLTGIKAESE